MSVDLVVFLTARLDEDEARARRGNPDGWLLGNRALREVEAKRAILAMHAERWRLYRTYEEAGEPGSISLGRAQGLSQVLHELSAVYSDHPDYRQKWAP